MSPSTVLHIGGAKTASTSMQRGLFGQTPGLRYFGELGDGSTTPEENKLVRSLLEDDDAFFAGGDVKALFARYLADSSDGTLVFSSADIPLASHPALIARRLRALVPDPVTVLLVVREQRDALSSFYSGHGAWLKPAPRPYYRRFVSFDSWLDYLWVEPASRTLRAFSYWHQISPYIEIFGLENVRVLPFEKVVRGDERTWEELGSLTSTAGPVALQRFRSHHERHRITDRRVRFGRLLRWTPPLASMPDVRAIDGPLGRILDGGGRFQPTWPDESATALGAFYEEGNAALGEAFGLPLRELGYPVGRERIS
jgi:hypothetical protein